MTAPTMTLHEFRQAMIPIENALRNRYPSEMVMVKRWENANHASNHPDYDPMPAETDFDCFEDFEDEWISWARRNPRAARKDRERRGCSI